MAWLQPQLARKRPDTFRRTAVVRTTKNLARAGQVIHFQGAAAHEPVALMRAMTMAGLWMYIDISAETWSEWKRSRPDLSEVIARAEAVVRRQKFEGAAADLLNPNIIARDLGLADKSEISGKGGGPIEVRDVTDISDEALLAIATGSGSGTSS